MFYVMYPGCDHVIKESREREKEGNRLEVQTGMIAYRAAALNNIIVIYGMGKSWDEIMYFYSLLNLFQ